MKTFRLLGFFAASALGLLAQNAAAPAPFNPPLAPAADVLAAPDVESAWKLVARLNDMEYLMSRMAGAKGDDKPARMREILADSLRISAAFYQKWPQDPRRWLAVANMYEASVFLANVDGTAKAPVPGVEWDAAAWAAWVPQIKELKAQIATAPDTPPELKFQTEMVAPGGLRDQFGALNKAVAAQQPADFAPCRAELLRLAAKYPTVKTVAQIVPGYIAARVKGGATKEQIVAEMTEWLQSPSQPLRAAAQKEIDKAGLKDKPLEIAFTAVDDRKVDLKELRGKVVLVDFWATWCGPCKAEIPNIKRVYAAYHDKGFEVVGISLENASLQVNDTAEQTAAKHEKAKQVLTEFTTKAGMPWPQYYDGKFWKNDISTRYDIAAIPAMFLIDQQGRLVSTNARGPDLEKEVKRLLGL